MNAAALWKGALASITRGALFSGGPMMLFTVPLAMMSAGAIRLGSISDVFVVVLLMLLPLLLAGLVVALAFVLIGLPLTLLLYRFRLARWDFMALLGAIIGGAVMVALSFSLLSGGALPFSILGVLGGFVTGKRWGEALAEDYVEAAAVES